MKLPRFLRRLFRSTAITPVRAGATPLASPGRKAMNVSLAALAASGAVVSAHVHNGTPVEAWTVPAAPKWLKTVELDGQPLLAMDSTPNMGGDFAALALGGYFKEGLGFLGYPYLAELTQRAEYRRPVEIIAEEMTRKWISFTTTGDNKKGNKLKKLEAAFKQFNVKDYFRKSAEGDGNFGRHQLFMDLGDADDQQELMRPLVTDQRKLGKGCFKGLRSVEAIWSYPSAFNAWDPLDEHYYKPQQWYVQAKAVHTSRLLTFVSRPLPDILKPAYCFGGLSLSQIMKPYVDNWLETRQSVNDLIQMFSTSVLKTDMGNALSGGDGKSLFNRVDMFNRTRTNRGTFVIDKNEEEFENVTAQLSGLDKLQAQAQEHMSAVSGIPLVILLGITPSGLNASSDGEIRTFYARIKDLQERLFRPNLQTLLEIIQLHLFGTIDPEIGFEFEPLWEDDAKTTADTEKAEADTANVYIQGGVIHPEEERERLSNKKDGMYAGVDLSGPPPELPANPSEETDPDEEPDEET